MNTKLIEKLNNLDLNKENTKILKETHKILFPYASIPRKIDDIKKWLLHILDISDDRLLDNVKNNLPLAKEHLEKLK